MNDLLGLAPGGSILSRDDFLDIIQPEDRSRLAAEVTSALHDGSEVEGQFRILRRSDGALSALSEFGSRRCGLLLSGWRVTAR
jgi:hypothetical protein